MRIIRELQKEDRISYLELLENLTVVGEISEEDFNQQLKELSENPVYKVFVVYDTVKDSIVASGTLLLEEKFIHQLGKVGHLEDIIVDKDYRGQGIGRIMIEYLTNEAKALNCYKVILNCDQFNAPFYQKIGFNGKNIEMSKYF